MRPGLVVLAHDGEFESTTPGVEQWLQGLPDGDWDAGRLPSAVLAVAGRALRSAEHPDQPGEVAVSRVLSRSGAWVVLHGAALVSGGARRVAVIVEPAHPGPDRTPADVGLWLTEREQEVTRLVLQGNSTTARSPTSHCGADPSPAPRPPDRTWPQGPLRQVC